MPVRSVAKVEACLAGLPAPARAALDRLRAQIRAAAPKAEEGFGYGLPGFYLDGPLFYYGAAKGHCALYGTVPTGFDDALSAFDRSKGTVRFMPDALIPAATVKRLVKAKAAENKARALAKSGAKAKRPARKADPR